MKTVLILILLYSPYSFSDCVSSADNWYNIKLTMLNKSIPNKINYKFSDNNKSQPELHFSELKGESLFFYSLIDKSQKCDLSEIWIKDKHGSMLKEKFSRIDLNQKNKWSKFMNKYKKLEFYPGIKVEDNKVFSYSWQCGLWKWQENDLVYSPPLKIKQVYEDNRPENAKTPKSHIETIPYLYKGKKEVFKVKVQYSLKKNYNPYQDEEAGECIE